MSSIQILTKKQNILLQTRYYNYSLSVQIHVGKDNIHPIRMCIAIGDYRSHSTYRKQTIKLQTVDYITLHSIKRVY